jgi:crotonobetainyl-CoA:carnitine CoA-transferase CaiB-like acyl-CoA transferase
MFYRKTMALGPMKTRNASAVTIILYIQIHFECGLARAFYHNHGRSAHRKILRTRFQTYFMKKRERDVCSDLSSDRL